MNASNWSVYLILCENSAFYCGISPNPQQRLAIHTAGKGAKYPRIQTGGDAYRCRRHG